MIRLEFRATVLNRKHVLATIFSRAQAEKLVAAITVNEKLDVKTENEAAEFADDPEGRNLKRRLALEQTRADIIAHRETLDGILDEFLAERREEARREMEGG